MWKAAILTLKFSITLNAFLATRILTAWLGSPVKTLLTFCSRHANSFITRCPRLCGPPRMAPRGVADVHCSVNSLMTPVMAPRGVADVHCSQCLGCDRRRQSLTTRTVNRLVFHTRAGFACSMWINHRHTPVCNTEFVCVQRCYRNAI